MAALTTQILLMGPAGSGKTSLTGRLAEWLTLHEGFKAEAINLDPGCDYIPYKANYDVRKHFTIAEIMKEEKLGPNGAMIKASELISERIKADMEAFYRSHSPDFTLIDTPGQTEIFLFRETGSRTVEELQRIHPTIGLYVVDPYVLDKPSSIASLFSLGMAVTLKLNMPLITVLNKIDLLVEVEPIKLIIDLDYLSVKLKEGGEGAVTDLALDLVDAVKRSAMPQRVIGVSAKTGEGFRNLLDTVRESFCECGDLT
ncbi:MAG: ATP/GTP-binding protein [Thermoproteota archaeon]